MGMRTLFTAPLPHRPTHRLPPPPLFARVGAGRANRRKSRNRDRHLPARHRRRMGGRRRAECNAMNKHVVDTKQFVTIEGRVLANALKPIAFVIERRNTYPILGMVKVEVT